MANPDFDTILSTTLKNYLPKLEDNVFTARPLVFFLKEAGQVRQVGGGAKIVIPIIHGKNSTTGSYTAYDTISTTPQEGITAAEYDWGQYAASIAISGIEEAMNASEEEVVDLLEGKIMQTEESIYEDMDIMFFGDGSGNSGKDWNGLDNLIGQNSDSVGGIDPSSNSYWESEIHDGSGSEVLSLGQMRNTYNTVSVGNDRPNVILTTQDLFEKYEDLLDDQVRYTDTRTADAGFQNLMFKGAPVTYDVHQTSGVMDFLNTKYIRLVGHRDNWFRPTPFVRPNNQDARYAQIICYGNLTVSNRSRQGRLEDMTTS